MSDYVEARYALVVLREVRLASDQLAQELVRDLARDLETVMRMNAARSDALTAIRLLQASLDHLRYLSLKEWEAAYRATEDWCQRAAH